MTNHLHTAKLGLIFSPLCTLNSLCIEKGVNPNTAICEPKTKQTKPKQYRESNKNKENLGKKWCIETVYKLNSYIS